MNKIEQHFEIYPLVVLLIAVTSCTHDNDITTQPQELDGTYTLVSENDQSVPTDPFAPDGCCMTLSGKLLLEGNSYSLSTTYQNKNNGIIFANSEYGIFSRSGNTLSFVRKGGGEYPYLLGPGTADGDTITLLHGDEGPGSNQIRAVFRRQK